MAQKSVVNGTIAVDMQDADDNFTELYTAVDALSAGSGVVISATDIASGFLSAKLLAGDNITLTLGNAGGNETLTISTPDDPVIPTPEGLLQSIVELTSGITWTCPAGINSVRGRMVGGGGGGSSSNTNISGGTGAGYCEFLVGVTPGETYTYSVGVGGAGGAAGESSFQSGTDGTATTFTVSGTTYTANGGNASITFYALGGTALNGDINISGDVSLILAVAGIGISAGSNSHIGVGGLGYTGTGNLKSPGYGGGGYSINTAFPTQASQDGGAGVIILELYS